MRLMNSKVLFDELRNTVFGGRLSQKQVDGVNRIVRAWELYGDGNDSKLANILGQTFHETGQRMQPVRETFAKSTKQAIARLDAAFKAGKLSWVSKPYWRDGWFGRGDIQLTHEDNYRRMGLILGLDLVSDPDLALDSEISARIAIEGMTRGVSKKGDFTGVSLANFTDPKTGKVDHEEARRVVNGKDRAKLIAGYCEAFEDAIEKARHYFETDGVPDEKGITDVTTEKKPWWSTTNWTAVGVALSAVANASDQIKEAVGNLTSAFNIEPQWFLGGLIVLGCLYIIRERVLKGREWGV